MYFDHCQSKINYGIILLGNSTNLNTVNLKKTTVFIYDTPHILNWNKELEILLQNYITYFHKHIHVEDLVSHFHWNCYKWYAFIYYVLESRTAQQSKQMNWYGYMNVFWITTFISWIMIKYEQYNCSTFPGLIHTVSSFLTCSSVQKKHLQVLSHNADSIFDFFLCSWYCAP